jgi:uncharacterized protein YnzC (UPF0291/DUF896 family)
MEAELDSLDRSRRAYLSQMRTLLARQLSEVEASETGRETRTDRSEGKPE